MRSRKLGGPVGKSCARSPIGFKISRELKYVCVWKAAPHSQSAEVLSKGWQQIFMGGERNVTTSLKPVAPSLRILWAHLRPLKADRLPVNPRAPAANSPTPGSGSSRLWRSPCVSFSSLAPLAGRRCAKEELLSLLLFASVILS